VQRALLNVGIACFIIAMVIEWILNNKFAIVFVIPLIYLISLRGRMGGKIDLKDVRAELVLLEDTLSLTYSGVTSEKGRFLDRRYVIERNAIRNVLQERDKGKITLLFDGTVNTMEPTGRIVCSQRVSRNTLPLFLPDELYGEVITWLGL